MKPPWPISEFHASLGKKEYGLNSRKKRGGLPEAEESKKEGWERLTNGWVTDKKFWYDTVYQGASYTVSNYVLCIFKNLHERI